MRLKDVMSTRVLTIDLHEPLESARSAMSSRRVHHVGCRGQERGRTGHP
jgi:hypothetical protein